MYLNDLNSASHNVDKINRVLANTFGHNVNVSEMSTNTLERMLTATNAKIQQIKESDLTYWENPQYNKLHLISHSLRTYINEVAPGRTDGKTMKTKVKESAELEAAEVMLAAQELVDELQKMVENLAEMQVQKLMPIVDAMKEQMGFEQAEAYNAAADAALAGLLDQAKAAKDALDNATMAARGEAPAAPAPTDMAMDPAMDMGDDDMSMDDDFAADPAASGEDNSVGREMKEGLDVMEAQAIKEKKFLEAKDRVFQMLEAGQISKEQFLEIVNSLKEADPYYGHNYKDLAYHDNTQKLPKGGMVTAPPKPKPTPKPRGMSIPGLRTADIRKGDVGYDALTKWFNRQRQVQGK